MCETEVCQDFWIGVASDLFATFIVTAPFLLLYLPYAFFSWLRPSLKFFGVTNSNPNLTIYCSRITTLGGGTRGNVQVGQTGPVISLLEWEAAEKVRGLLSGRLFPVLPKGLQHWLHEKAPTWTPLTPNITVSDDRQNQAISRLLENPDQSLDSIINSNLILIGSSAYNSFVEVLESRSLTAACFSRDERFGLRCFRDKNDRRLEPAREPSLNEDGKPILDNTGNIVLAPDSAEGALIQRIILEDKITIIICAGTSSNATLNAVAYLVQNWKKSKLIPKAGAFAYYLAWYGLPLETENAICEPSRIYPIK